jgi:ADP-heptose:LPS heptosyltransferase
MNLGKNFLFENFLFIELVGGIGDLLIALPAIQALARSRPRAAVVVLTSMPGGGLLQHDPRLEMWTIPAEEMTEPHRLSATVAQAVTSRSWELIISDTAYHGIAEIAHGSGARRVIADLWDDAQPDERVADAFTRRLLAAGLIAPQDILPVRLVLTAAERAWGAAMLNGLPHPHVLLGPGSQMPIKRWPADYCVTVARRLQARLGAQVLIPDDGERTGTKLVARIGCGAMALPPMPLRGFAALTAQVDLCVSTDSMAAHLAAALGVPTVTLFGPTWHARYAPPAPNRALQGMPDCRERDLLNHARQRCWFSGHCPLGWPTCVAAIAPEAIVAACERMLCISTVRG